MVRNGNRPMSETTGSRVKNRIMREVRGGNTPVARSNPPKVNMRPWYPLVVELRYEQGVSHTVTVVELLEAVTKQLGFQSVTSKELCVRLHMVRAWAVPEQRDAYIEMYTSSLIPTVQAAVGGSAQYGIVNSITDTGSVTDWAKVGYNWPVAQSDVLLTQTADFQVSEFVGPTDNGLVVHYHLHWTTTGRADPPSRRTIQN